MKLLTNCAGTKLVTNCAGTKLLTGCAAPEGPAPCECPETGLATEYIVSGEWWDGDIWTAFTALVVEKVGVDCYWDCNGSNYPGCIDASYSGNYTVPTIDLWLDVNWPVEYGGPCIWRVDGGDGGGGLTAWKNTGDAPIGEYVGNEFAEQFRFRNIVVMAAP